ncbi:ABC transporter substrate-binding protein, partial [Georgenia sp. 10Sc9-8]|nr:ABC transporter substrate-binding protein [Georgenia halotolerans]
MNRRHTLPLTGLVSVLALAACSTGTGTADEAADPFRIGVYAPMTGEMAEYGETFQRAFDLYLAQVEEAGGVEGHPVELEIRDDRGEPRQAANIAQELVDDPSIDATIGSFSSAASMAAAPIIERGGMPNISPTSSHPDYTAQGEYLFRNVNTQEIEGELNADFLHQELGEASAAVVHRQDDWGLSAAEAFDEGFAGLGGEVVHT